jgi:hypothetical protein
VRRVLLDLEYLIPKKIERWKTYNPRSRRFPRQANAGAGLRPSFTSPAGTRSVTARPSRFAAHRVFESNWFNNDKKPGGTVCCSHAFTTKRATRCEPICFSTQGNQ